MLQHVVTAAEAAGHGVEVAAGDAPSCRAAALGLPLDATHVGVLDPLGDDDADAAAVVLADDGDRGSGGDDGVTLAAAEVADAEARVDVAATRAAAAGITAGRAAAEAATGGCTQCESADGGQGREAATDVETQRTHGISSRVGRTFLTRTYTRASDHILPHSFHNFHSIL